MSIAELVPAWKALDAPSGRIINDISLRGRMYRLRKDVEARLNALGILSSRGIADDPEVFLHPQLQRDMPDPMLLKDMEKAAERIARAVLKREKVIIFGDYDVDGASSSAVFGRWFEGLGLPVSVYIPDRMSEGYGPSVKAIDKALAEGGDLLICVDCGTASAEILNSLSIDVIVVDHHQQQGDLPDVVAVINPHRNDDESGLGMMCATALSFMTVVAAQAHLRNLGALPSDAPKVINLLDIVALATVADVVPLIGPSRLFVSKGLEVIAKRPSTGIKALMQVSGISDINAGRIGFALGPRVNAGGRVGVGSGSENGALGVRLLMAKDPVEANRIAAELDAMNKERQEIQKNCQDEAMVLAEEQVGKNYPLISVFGNGWHAGVVGIVAGRIKERFDVPCLVGALDNGKIKGSGRSVPGLDLGAMIVEAKKRGLLEAGGGHAMACGFTCKMEEWTAFETFMRSRAKWDPEPLPIDCHVHADLVNMHEIESLMMLEPFGQGNPNVKAMISGLRINSVRQIKNGHVQLEFFHKDTKVHGIWWRAAEEGFHETLLDLQGSVVTVIGSPKIDEWQGRKKISLELADIIP